MEQEDITLEAIKIETIEDIDHIELEDIELSPEQEEDYLIAIDSIENSKLFEKNPGYFHFVKKLYRIAARNGAQLILNESEKRPTEEELTSFSESHCTYYQKKSKSFAKEMAEIQKEGTGEIIYVESGMYGGKNTFAEKLIGHIKRFVGRKNHRVIRAISSPMGEDFITVRALNKKFEAMKYGPLLKPEQKKEETDEAFQERMLEYEENKDNPEYYYDKIRNQIDEYITQDKKVILLLDEISFLFNRDLKKAEAFIEENLVKGVNIIALGLNKDYTGTPLEFFDDNHRNKIFRHLHYDGCTAFRAGVDIASERPTGEWTSRYINIDGLSILDLVVLPLVTSKEDVNLSEEPIATYIPATRKQVMRGIFGEELTDQIRQKQFENEKTLDENKSVLTKQD